MASANALGVTAGRQITQGLDALSSLALNREDEIQKENTQTVLDRIYAMNSVDEVEGALTSGAYGLDALNKEFGNKGVNVAKVRDALMERDNQIMTDENTRYEYDTNLTKRKDTPLLDRKFSELISAGSLDEIDNITTGLDESGLSEAGILAVRQAEAKAKQHLLDLEDAKVNREREAINFGNRQESHGWAESNQAFTQYNQEQQKMADYVNNYERDNVLKYNSTLSSANAELEKIEKKYPTNVDLDAVVEKGTAIDAIASYVQSLDASKVDVGEVQKVLENKLIHNGDKEVFKVNVGERENGRVVEKQKSYTLNTLPKWVVEQSLKSIGEISDDWYFSDLGKGDLKFAQREKFVKDVQRNLELYTNYRLNTLKKEDEQSRVKAVVADAHSQELARVLRAEQAFKQSLKPKKSL
ncbi:MAG: hypothetical protein [Podoviridae sp. ctLUJ1]|nr:MAG: hypothetical protein [Podoviridae sp. ctLUJ1]